MTIFSTPKTTLCVRLPDSCSLLYCKRREQILFKMAGDCDTYVELDCLISADLILVLLSYYNLFNGIVYVPANVTDDRVNRTLSELSDSSLRIDFLLENMKDVVGVRMKLYAQMIDESILEKSIWLRLEDWGRIGRLIKDAQLVEDGRRN